MLSVFVVIDDDEADQIIAERAIKSYNPESVIHSCRDGIEALALLATLAVPPDLIFLDINMPRMNGHDFLQTYSEQGFSAPTVVMLTSSNQAKDRERASAYACVIEYLEKPLEVEDCIRLEARLVQ